MPRRLHTAPQRSRAAGHAVLRHEAKPGDAARAAGPTGLVLVVLECLVWWKCMEMYGKRRHF